MSEEERTKKIKNLEVAASRIEKLLESQQQGSTMYDLLDKWLTETFITIERLSFKEEKGGS